MGLKTLPAAAILLALFSSEALAQAHEPPRRPAAAPDHAPLSSAQRETVLSSIKQAISASYAFPDRATAIFAKLDAAQRSGRYEASSPSELAGLISSDLRDASMDGHLYLQQAPERYAAAIRAQANEAAWEVDAVGARRVNHGITTLEVLPGNVRYVKIATFHWVQDETGAAYDDAMRFLKEGDAAIIDLRGNGGGSPEAVQYLVSHFLKAGTLEITFFEAGKAPVQARSLDYLPAGRLTNTPLYVLIDKGSASAAEAFAYDVQQFKLGRLVGARTAGAANNNQFKPIAPSFMLSLSVGSPVHAVSGGNWEGEGVAPDTVTTSAQALDQAHAEALRALSSQTGSAVAKADHLWALAAVEARLNPPKMNADQLASAPGAYQNYAVAKDGSGLSIDRQGHPFWPAPRKLIPLTSDGLFGVEGLDILRVSFKDGALQLWWKDAQGAQSIPRR